MTDNETFTYFKQAVDLFAATMNDYLYVYDMTRGIYYITERAVERFALETNYFRNVDDVFKKLVYEDDFVMLKKDLDDVLAGKKSSHNMRYRWMSREGKPVWINCQGRCINDSKTEDLIMIGCINEIGQRTKADNISGLLGEVSLREQLEQFRKKPKCYFMRIGIDDFKNINESLGTDYGDHVIYDVANAISDCLQMGQYVYRMNYDEFMVFDLLSNSKKSVKDLYKLIRTHIDSHIRLHEYEAIYTISAGLVSYRDLDVLDFDEIDKLSQFALTCAKDKGKNQIANFDRDQYETFVSNRYMTRELRRAVSKSYRGFELYFQPIVDASTGEIYAAESLLRYCNEAGQMMPPGRFVGQLEESGLIVPVGRWIVETAVEACLAIQRYKPDFKVTINFSYIQIFKSPMYDDLVNIIEKYGIDPSSIIVELTESGYLARSQVVVNLWQKLKAYGILIALDDFGTGYSNLSSISQMQPDILKIDRGFTLKALNNNYDRQLLTQIIDMSHSLGIKEVVEGIEEKEELDQIVALGPDYIQGFYYGKPCDFDSFMEQFIDTAK